jgi:hypothetical protein
MITCRRLAQFADLSHYRKNHTDIIMEEKEKRAATRIEALFEGIMIFEAEGQGIQAINVVSKDVSADGAYLWADAPKACPSVGDKIGIHLHCTYDFEQLKIVLPASATVVRVDKPHKERHGFAVKFDKVLDSEPG